MTTSVIYPTSDVNPLGSDVNYATARSTYAAANSGYLDPGQYGAYYCTQSGLSFDTSVVGTDDISSAVLTLEAAIDYTTTDFIVEARLHTGFTTAATCWVAGASLSGLTLLAHHDTTAFTPGVRYNFVDDALAANINKTGNTQIHLSSSRQRVGNAPSGNEQSVWYDSASGAHRPTLTIVHAAPAVAHLKIRRSGVWVTVV